ncbi:MAG: hypothetical protein AAB678_01010 [Patescibacteria group bacterium]
MARDFLDAAAERAMREAAEAAAAKKETSPQKAETELSAKKWSPVEARQVLETKLDLLRSAKSNDEVLKLKKNILFDVRKQLEKCAAADISRRQEIYNHIQFLEDIAGADIEDIYNKIEPKRLEQIEKIKDFVEEEKGDLKRIEAKRAQIIKKQGQIWSGMKGAAVKGQRAEARAEAAQFSPTRKTQEVAMAREAENTGALVEADVYEEQNKPKSKVGKFFRKLFGVQTVAEEATAKDQLAQQLLDKRFGTKQMEVEAKTWAGMKGAAVKGQRAEARAEAAQFSPTRKTQEVAMAREAENTGALVEADVYEEQNKPSGFGKLLNKIFGRKILTGEETAKEQAGEQMEAEMLKKAEKQISAPVVEKKSFTEKAKEFVSPASYNVYIEGAGAVPRSELKNNIKLIRDIQGKVENEVIKQFEALPELAGLSEKEKQTLWKKGVEKGEVTENIAAKLVENSANINQHVIAQEVGAVLSKMFKEYRSTQKVTKAEIYEGRRVAAEEAAEALPDDKGYLEDTYTEGLLHKMSKEKVNRIQKVLVEDALRDVDKNKYFNENFDKAMAKLKITDAKVIDKLKTKIFKVLGQETLSTLRMNEVRAEQIRKKLEPILNKYDEGRLEDLVKSA